MANDGQIVFEVEIDSKNAKADLKDVTRAIANESKNWDKSAKKSTDSIGNSFGSMLKGIAAAFSAAKIGQALLDIGKAAVQAASDLEEVQNVVDVTFGDDADKIEDWAKRAGTQFGLTEVQAKKFSSTMGAMLKSAGLAGSEITQVSTDLAGLAADMASFYNLDFDTAFQKIRSGISGETEPLKQLGINMSVANLNAYALQKGLTKTFDQMSQGEQTMLRYQYIMSATADAQGDFARTSDGYANSMRMLETNLTELKTSLGTYIIPYVKDLVVWTNKLFPKEEKNDSILQQIADVQLKRDEKIAEIEAISEVATELISTLEKIGTDTNATTTLATFASGANSLDASSVSNWSNILSSLQGIDGLDNLFGDENTGTLESLASALSGNSVSTTKAQAWQTFLGALSSNVDAVSKLTGKSAEDTEEWLKGMAEAAGELDESDAAAWDKLMSSLVSGISLDTDEGRQFVNQLTQNFLAMGKDSTEAVNGLSSLGYTTDEINSKQTEWLRTCQELAHTIPGLSDIIDTNTGEVKGGIPALKAYADEWERTAKYQAEIEALKSAKDIYNENNNQAVLNAEVTAKRSVAFAKLKTFGLLEGYGDEVKRQALNAVGDFMTELVQGGEVSWEHIKNTIFDQGYNSSDLPLELQEMLSLTGEAREALLEYAEAQFRASLIEKERPIVLAEIESEEQRLAEETGQTTEEIKAQTESTKQAAAAMTTLERAANGDETALTAVTDAIINANDALVALGDYVDSVHKKVESSISSVVKGFGSIETPMMKNRKNVKDLEESITKLDSRSKTYKEDLAKINEELAKQRGEQISAQSVGKNLQQQAKYMEDYLANLRKARELGLSADVLAALSDGSTESYDVLEQLAQASPEEVATINAAYQDVIDKRKELSDELTQQQLTVDETYQTLATKAQEAVAALDLEQSAKDNAGKTVQGVVDGITSHLPDVTDAVNAIMSEFDRLAGFGITVDVDAVGLSITKGNQSNRRMINNRNGQYDFIEAFGGGVDYVPFDMYARIHEGEKILNAQEAAVYRNLLNGGTAGVDLDALGGVMRDNVKPGGNVYLDGKVVGAVVSDRQGRSYKSLQRSGWQS